jgi:hypothetical protein
MSELYVKAIKSAIFGIIAFAALIFLPAGTLNYWQGWAFLATFVFSTLIITVYLARHDPKLLERRLSAGPQAEKKPALRRFHHPNSGGSKSYLNRPIRDC